MIDKTQQSWGQWLADGPRYGLSPNPERKPCTCCGKRRNRLSRDEYCHPCLRYQYGYDDAQATFADALIGGMVAAGLKVGLSGEEVMLATQRAITRDHGNEVDSIIGHLSRPRALPNP